MAFDPSDGSVLQQWDAVSGKLDDNGNTDPDELQIVKVGPIPEGEFTVNSDDSNQNRFYKRRWGNESDWGNIRTEIKPNVDTDTHGRDGFYMHGGDDPGSAGCVDLTDQNNDFHDWLAEQDEAVELTVEYTDFNENPGIDIDSGLRIAKGPNGAETVINFNELANETEYV